MFCRDATRPIALKRVPERLGLSNTAIRIAHDVFNYEVDSSQGPRIRFLPVEIFFLRLGREDEIHGFSFNFFRMPLPLSSDSMDFSSRLAFAGERSR